MILGIGTDIVEIERIQEVLSRHGKRFLHRILTLKEQECAHGAQTTQFLAGRFAAKEAISKALGTGISDGVAWTDIEILNDELGKPVVMLAEHVRERFQNPQIDVSISHSKLYAIAFAIRSIKS